MKQFKNMLPQLTALSKIDFKLAVNIRRIRMEKEGFNTTHINWEHYAKVLEAKHAELVSA